MQLTSKSNIKYVLETLLEVIYKRNLDYFYTVRIRIAVIDLHQIILEGKCFLGISRVILQKLLQPQFLPTFFHAFVNRFLELGTIVKMWILHPIQKFIHDERRIRPRIVHACFQITTQNMIFSVRLDLVFYYPTLLNTKFQFFDN